jgi:hypothetical protein
MIAPARSLERATEEYRLAGDEAGVGGCIHSIGDLDLAAGDLPTALERYREASPLILRSGSSFDVAVMVGAFAAAAAQAGDLEAAGTLWGAFERLHADSERVVEADTLALYEGSAGQLDPIRVAAGRELSEDDAVALAQRTADNLAASLRSRLARTSGHSSSSTE